MLYLQPATPIDPLNKRLPDCGGLEDYTKFIILRLWLTVVPTTTGSTQRSPR